MDKQSIENISKIMRRRILDISYRCNVSAHLGGGLSIVDILAILYGEVLKFNSEDPFWDDRDRFILSKGHGVLGFFSALRTVGIISEEKFNTFQTNESDLIAHPVMNLSLGIESSNGSLGHGLSMGVGLAIAAKKKNRDNKVYVLLGDGECNEGSVWEAVMSASHFMLDNLVAIVDYNRYQSDGESNTILNSGEFSERWKSFGWDTYSVDGHNIEDLYNAFIAKNSNSKPKVIIAHTIKGKGITFMENNNAWHHNRLTKSLYEKALQELNLYD